MKRTPSSTCPFHNVVLGLLSLEICLLSLQTQGIQKSRTLKTENLGLTECCLLCCCVYQSQCTSVRQKFMGVFLAAKKVLHLCCIVKIVIDSTQALKHSANDTQYRVSQCLLSLSQNYFIAICLRNMFCLQNLFLCWARGITFDLFSYLLPQFSPITLKCQTVYLPLEILFRIVKCNIESFTLLPWNLE